MDDGRVRVDGDSVSVDDGSVTVDDGRVKAGGDSVKVDDE